MAATTNFSVRMDSDIKRQCEALYNELGMNLTTAINVFLLSVRSNTWNAKRFLRFCNA